MLANTLPSMIQDPTTPSDVLVREVGDDIEARDVFRVELHLWGIPILAALELVVSAADAAPDPMPGGFPLLSQSSSDETGRSCQNHLHLEFSVLRSVALASKCFSLKRRLECKAS